MSLTMNVALEMCLELVAGNNVSGILSFISWISFTLVAWNWGRMFSVELCALSWGVQLADQENKGRGGLVHPKMETVSLCLTCMLL